MPQSSSAVRYRFALDENRRLVDVNDLNRPAHGPARDRFACFGCGARLIAHLKDDLRARHFAHYRADGCAAYETYLHRAGKAAFLETYQSCLQNQKPFTVRVPVVDKCTTFRAQLGFECARAATREFDLTRWFDSASEETQFDGFRPDVLLKSSKSGRAMFVEIAVAHQCEQAKIDCGVRILEIAVASDDDIAAIHGRQIVVDEKGATRVYNFKLKPEEGAFCAGDCPRQVYIYVVHKSGRPKFFTKSAAQALTFKPPSAVWQRVLTKFEEAPPFVGLEHREYLGHDLPPGNSLMQRAAMAAMRDGVTVRTCEVCRNQGAGSFANIWCHTFREDVHPSRAATCTSFKPARSLAELQQILKRNEDWLNRRHRR